jgi:hypothetical protein
MLEITWIEWQLMGGPESKMGTYTTMDLSYSSPRLYQYLRSVLETNTNKKPNVKLIIEEESEIEQESAIEEIENEERSLILRLEQLQKIKKINHLKNEKNNLQEQVKSLNTLIGNIDELIEELK